MFGHMPHCRKHKQLRKQSIDERFSMVLPVGVADVHQYNRINPPQRALLSLQMQL